MAGAGIEAVDDSGAALREDSIAIDRWSGAGANVAEAALYVRRVESRFDRVGPHGLAGFDAVTCDELVLAALLLRDGIVAGDCKRRPSSANLATPQLFGRVRLPVG